MGQMPRETFAAKMVFRSKGGSQKIIMFENKTIADSLSELKTSQESGLSANEVETRRKKYGLNKLEEKKGEAPS
jgi:magnesium-transporting ATPase (P-type)